MNDPYSVLGVSPGADEESIKKAYRQKCKQYHPDLHPNDPASEEHFKEVQAAYSEVMRQRNGGGAQGSYRSADGYGGQGGAYQSPFGFGGYGFGFNPFGFGGYGFSGAGRSYADASPELQAAGNYLRNGYYQEALNLLDRMPSAEHTARWHYYAALACNGLGNNIRALEEARAAAEMEPGNYQYQNLLARLQGPGRSYTAYRQGQPQPGAPGGNCLSVWMYMMMCNALSCLCCRGRFFCC